jgi:hypothetical protein
MVKSSVIFCLIIRCRVADQLAKLMCMQEYHSRNNNVSAANSSWPLFSAFEATDPLQRSANRKQKPASNTEMVSDESDGHYEECDDQGLWDVPPSPPTSASPIAPTSRYRELSTSEEDNE